jgi:alpha-L-fucosidase
MQSELSELLNNYGRIDVMWFDWDGRAPLYDQTHTYALVKKSQPGIIIDNRLDLGPADNDTKMLSPFADYYTPEQHIGAYDDLRPWETCMTLGTQWSWKPNDNIKTAAEVIAILARTAGGDGNLLLDVGPMPDGRIESRQVQVLQQVGAWMKKNGQSIYATRGGPFEPADYGATTRKGKMIYLHVLKWPEGPLKLPDIRARIVSAKLLRGGKADVRQRGGEIEISVAPAERDASDTVVALKLDSDALKIPAVAVPLEPTQHPH